MLVLSRQRDETIMIGDEIEISVVDIRGDKVRLGITAPTRIAVHRKEVYEAIKRENTEASRIADDAISAADIQPGPAKTGRAKASKASGLAAKAGAPRNNGTPPPTPGATRVSPPSADAGPSPAKKETA
ncbi:MAG: carbon storage regulator CsrA [Phycisphaerales bacterium]